MLTNVHDRCVTHSMQKFSFPTVGIKLQYTIYGLNSNQQNILKKEKNGTQFKHQKVAWMSPVVIRCYAESQVCIIM